MIHDMRLRIITSDCFNDDKIFGTILFEKEMDKKINDMYISDYLISKNIFPFIKIDKGLLNIENGVSLMKKIPNLSETLEKTKKHNFFGTKMRSVIYEFNKQGIEDIVKEQFYYAKKIYDYNLIPILEPEIDINCKEKHECEVLLKEEIVKQLSLAGDMKIILKLSLPSEENFYKDIINHKNVLKVLALSGGYDRKTACEKLSNNNGMCASFSRALLSDLRAFQDDYEFNNILSKSINEIFEASIK